MLLDPRTTAIVALVAVVVAVLALLGCLLLAARLRTPARRPEPATPLAPAETPAVEPAGRSVELRAELDGLRAELAGVRGALADALQHVSVVRYDAFGDMGGLLSFSVALLDAAGDGVVLSSINGRSDTRTYAKTVRGWASEHALSPEEQEALAATLPPGVLPREQVEPEPPALAGANGGGGSRWRRSARG